MTTWLKAVLIRTLRTGAQVAIAAIGTSALVTDVDWGGVASLVGMSMVLSVLSAIATGLPEVPDLPARDRLGRFTSDDGQSWVGPLLIFLIGFILGALCYANDILVGAG